MLLLLLLLLTLVLLAAIVRRIHTNNVTLHGAHNFRLFGAMYDIQF